MNNNHLHNRIHDCVMPERQSDRQRKKIENRLIANLPSRQVKNSIMVDIDRLCLLVVAERMGLKDDDISLDPVEVAKKCGIG